MKRTLLAVGLLTILVGCSKTVYVDDTTPPNTTEKKVTTTTDAPVATPAPTLPPMTYSAEDEFLYDVYDGYDGIIYVSDSEMIETAYIVCDSLRSGTTAAEVVYAIMGAGGDTEFLTTVVAAAVANFCPDQMWKFN